MFLSMLLIGAALALRSPVPTRSSRLTPLAIAGLIAALAGCGVVLATLWAPTANAEEQQRLAATALSARDAISRLEQADHDEPIDPFYLSLAARTAAETNPRVAPPDSWVRQLLADAIAKNPRDIALYLARIGYLRRAGSSDAAQMTADFSTLIDLNPTDVQIRLEYGDYLWDQGKIDAARQQYRAALRLNEQLDAVELKRIEKQASASRLAEILQRAGI